MTTVTEPRVIYVTAAERLTARTLVEFSAKTGRQVIPEIKRTAAAEAVVVGDEVKLIAR